MGAWLALDKQKVKQQRRQVPPVLCGARGAGGEDEEVGARNHEARRGGRRVVFSALTTGCLAESLQGAESRFFFFLAPRFSERCLRSLNSWLHACWSETRFFFSQTFRSIVVYCFLSFFFLCVAMLRFFS